MKPNLFTLRTGKKFYAHANLLSVRKGDRTLYHGYDSVVEQPDDFGDEGIFTPEERAEIAEYMMELWRAWGGLK